MNIRTFISSVIFSVCFAIGFMLNIVFFQWVAWIMVSLFFLSNMFVASTLLFKTKEMISEISKKFSRKQWAFMTFSPIPFTIINTYIFNGYQIQYVYIFSSSIIFISGLITLLLMKPGGGPETQNSSEI